MASLGAAAGRSWIPTATVRTMTFKMSVRVVQVEL